MDEIEPGTARRGPNGRVAVKMAPNVTAGAWFIIDPAHGGHYTSGEREGVPYWPDGTFDEPEA